MKLSKYKHAFSCPSKRVHMSGVLCQRCASSTSGCTFVYWTGLYRIQKNSIFILSSRCPEASLNAELMQLILLHFTRYCTEILKMFYFLNLLFAYYFFEKYYTSVIVQYYVADYVMTNLYSILKSRDVTLPTKVHIVKAMVFQQSYMDMRVGL